MVIVRLIPERRAVSAELAGPWRITAEERRAFKERIRARFGDAWAEEIPGG